MFKKKLIIVAMTAMLFGGSMTMPVTAHAATNVTAKSTTATLASSSSLKKALYRAEFKTVVMAGKAAGYSLAAKFLDHSLQNNPSAVSYTEGSEISTKIEQTSEFTSLLQTIDSKLADGSLSTYETSGILNFTSDTDLKLAIHGVKYGVIATRIDGSYKIEVTFHDTYNFEASEWSQESFSSKVLNALNNHAASAQSAGAIVPYDITIQCVSYFIY